MIFINSKNNLGIYSYADFKVELSNFRKDISLINLLNPHQ